MRDVKFDRKFRTKALCRLAFGRQQRGNGNRWYRCSRGEWIVIIFFFFLVLSSLSGFSSSHVVDEERINTKVKRMVIRLYRHTKSKTKEPMIYSHCYTTTTESTLATKSDCCQALMTAFKQVFDGIHVPHGVIDSCEMNMIPLTVPSNISQSLPTFSYWYVPSTAVSVKKSIMVPTTETSVDDFEAKIFVFDMDTEIGKWVDDDDDDDDNDLSSIQSILSTDGGMHRELHHQIHELSLSSSSTSYVLVHIPSDLFVNVEDFFQNIVSNKNVKISLVSPNHVIDQEEPAFVSPSHAFYIELETSILSLQPVMMDLNFSAKLHVRYPMPSQDNNNNFMLAFIPPPLLFTSSSATTKESNSNYIPMSIWVAVGHQQDLIPVLLITLTVAIMAAYWTLRDISKVSQW